MSLIYWLPLALGLLIAIAAVLYALHETGRIGKLRQKFGKPKWWEEEMRCNKCMNSPEPGWLHHTTFNPITETQESAKFPCDRCDKTGKMKVAVISDSLSPAEYAEVEAEIIAAHGYPGHTIKRESEVEK
jgi:hypothetical protein